jgi:hypothetical protein
MATSTRAFVIYGREKKGPSRWERFDAQTYSTRSGAEYAVNKLKSRPDLSHLDFEVRDVPKTTQGFKDSQRKGPTFKNTS